MADNSEDSSPHPELSSELQTHLALAAQPTFPAKDSIDFTNLTSTELNPWFPPSDLFCF